MKVDSTVDHRVACYLLLSRLSSIVSASGGDPASSRVSESHWRILQSLHSYRLLRTVLTDVRRGELVPYYNAGDNMRTFHRLLPMIRALLTALWTIFQMSYTWNVLDMEPRTLMPSA